MSSNRPTNLKIAVTGATGFIGSHTVSRLLSQGHRVSALVRDKEKAGAQLGSAELFEGRVEDVPSMVRCFRECDAVVHCVGIRRETGGVSFDTIHSQGTRNLISAMRQSDLKRVVYLSFLQARSFLDSPYHHTKWQGEESLRNAGLDYTILKPGVVYGARDGFLSGIRRTLNVAPFFALPPGPANLVAPLYVGDLVAAAEKCLHLPETVGKTFALVGPDRLTFRELIEKVGSVTGVTPSFLTVPLALQRLAALIMGRTMKEPLVSESQLTILTEPLTEPLNAVDPLPEALHPTTPFHLD